MVLQLLLEFYKLVYRGKCTSMRVQIPHAAPLLPAGSMEVIFFFLPFFCSHPFQLLYEPDLSSTEERAVLEAFFPGTTQVRATVLREGATMGTNAAKYEDTFYVTLLDDVWVSRRVRRSDDTVTWKLVCTREKASGLFEVVLKLSNYDDILRYINEQSEKQGFDPITSIENDLLISERFTFLRESYGLGYHDQLVVGDEAVGDVLEVSTFDFQYLEKQKVKSKLTYYREKFKELDCRYKVTHVIDSHTVQRIDELRKKMHLDWSNVWSFVHDQEDSTQWVHLLERMEEK